MAKVKVNTNKIVSKPKKTRQGSSTNTKNATHKGSKLYKKKYRGQGRG